MGKGRSKYRRRNLDKGEPSKKREKEKDKDKDLPICYECKKLRHYRSACLTLKRSFKNSTKKKVMAAT